MLVALLSVALIGLALLAWIQRRQLLALLRRLERARRELEILQSAFARFAPAQVVDDIAADGISTRTEKKEVTVLFADLKGFTALSEAVPPAELVALLNGYLQRMSEVIVQHRGHVSELIGDGILAFFGALDVNPWQSNDAVGAALAMRRALTEYNAALREASRPPLHLSVGIHRGPVVAGLIGSAGLMKYGAIGLTLNLAARVEQLTRTHDVDILVSEDVQRVLDRRFQLRAMPATMVKGISEPIVTYAVDGFSE
jgi:adenylate cyclase